MKVQQDLNTIMPIFSNLEIYGRLHPRIEQANRIASDDGFIQYQIVERPFSWIPIHIKYAAKVKQSPNRLQYTIQGIPLTKAIYEYQFLPRQEWTVIKLTIQVESKLPITKLLINKMVQAQEVLIQSLQNQISK